jgi:hypothetical protein
VNVGSTSEVSVTWISVAGTHLFKATIDPNNTLGVSNATGRVATLQVYVGPSLGPTLTVNVPTVLVSSNASLWIKVNGVKYNLTSSQLQTTVSSGTVTLQIQPAVNTSPGTRQAFSAWSDGSTANPRQITVKNNTQLSANFNTQYFLTVDSNHGSASPDGWYNANSTARVSVTTPSNVTENTSRLLFTGWSGDYTSNSTSLAITMTKPVNVQANWMTQYYVTIITPTGSPSGEGWYNLGTTATVTIQPLIQFANQTRYVFIGWNQTSFAQATNLQIRINSPTKLQANWERQYLVQIQSSYGTPEGSGWYNAGSSAQISIKPEIDYPNRTRLIFSGWTGDYSTPSSQTTVQVNAPKNLLANWITQYKLTFQVTGVPNSTVVTLNVDNRTYQVSPSSYYSGWYSRGDEINPTTNSTIVNQIFVYSFAGWRNSTGTVQTPVVVSAPEEYTAQYNTQLTLPPVPGFPIESISLGILLGIMLMLNVRRRRIKGSSKSTNV